MSNQQSSNQITHNEAILVEEGEGNIKFSIRIINTFLSFDISSTDPSNSKPDDDTRDENKVNESTSGCDQSTQTENDLVKQSPSNPENMSDDQSCDQITHL